MRDGFSPDRIVADPELNARFVAACRERGLQDSVERLNAALLNLRKSGALQGIKVSKRTSFANEEEYRFAAEVAVRYLETRYAVTLDQIICSPDFAAQFDAIAARIAPGHSSLPYRWAALYLRKTRCLRPEAIAHAVTLKSVELGLASEVHPEELPAEQGIYIFYCPIETLYIGETANLRKRIAKHLDHSDNRELAHWFWENGIGQVHLEVRFLPMDTPTRVRKAMETELIRSRRPRFNIVHM